MNKNKLAVLILVVAIAGGVGYGIGSAVLGQRTSKPQDVEVVDPISPSITTPEPTVFAPDAINPTVQITIGDNNQNPIGN